MAGQSRQSPILLLGSSGQLGWELQRTLAPLGQVVAASRQGTHGPRIDLADPDGLRRLFAEVRPWMVVNAAAYTAVDRAESEPELAHAINAAAPGLIGELARAAGAGVVHYSTDYVFDGATGRPCREVDAVAPINVYGRSKFEGECALLDSGASALIFRTAWVYGLHGHNFLRTMLRLFAERDEVRVVSDQIGAPTWSRMIAEATAQVLSQLKADRSRLDEVGGLYHLTAAGETSWHGFAQAILELSRADCRLLPITTAEYPTPARRPARSVLDHSKLRETFGLALPDWADSLRQCLESEV